MSGINASGSQWCGCIFMLCYTHLKMALLLYKQGLVATGIATTVDFCTKLEKFASTISAVVQARTIRKWPYSRPTWVSLLRICRIPCDRCPSVLLNCRTQCFKIRIYGVELYFFTCLLMTNFLV